MAASGIGSPVPPARHPPRRLRGSSGQAGGQRGGRGLRWCRRAPTVLGTSVTDCVAVDRCAAARFLSLAVSLVKRSAGRPEMPPSLLPLGAFAVRAGRQSPSGSGVKARGGERQQHSAVILTALNIRLGSKGPKSTDSSEQASKSLSVPTPSKLMTRVRFPSPAPLISMLYRRSAAARRTNLPVHGGQTLLI